MAGRDQENGAASSSAPAEPPAPTPSNLKASNATEIFHDKAGKAYTGAELFGSSTESDVEQAAAETSQQDHEEEQAQENSSSCYAVNRNAIINKYIFNRITASNDTCNDVFMAGGGV